jgi:hypothetical protein
LYGRPVRRFWIALAVLACIRIAIPLAALAHADLPGLPRYRHHGLSGDATGFYAATREFMAGWGRLPRVALALLALVVIAFCVWLVREWLRRPARRPWLAPLALLVFGLVVCADVAEQNPSGAAVFGWPLLWGVVLLPVRAVGHLDQQTAFDVGVPLQLAFNVVTLVATALAGLYATGRRSVALLAAAVWTFWPFLSGAIAGHSAWDNGSWAIDAGLHMYTEPLSTALCATALALLLSPRLTELRLALAGCALSFATLVKLSNGITAGLALVALAWRFRGERRRVLPFLAGALSLAPLVLVYWPLSYPKLFHNPQSFPQKPFELHYLVASWSDSLVFHPHTLAIIVPLAAVGCFVVGRPWPLALLAIWTLVNPIFYSFYANTPLHPRFLYASLPSFFVLWAAGAELILRRLRSLLGVRQPGMQQLRS